MPPTSQGSIRWSPDGRSLLFLDHSAQKSVLWVAGLDGRARKLRENVDAPEWSPDGRRIAWATARRTEANQLRGDVHVMEADGRRPRQLTRGPAYDLGPFWSRDGTRILWWVWSGRQSRLWTMRPDGRGKRLVFPPSRAVGLGDISPDGRRFVFTDALKAGALFVGRLDGTGVRRIVRGEVAQPSWSPVDDQIAFLDVGRPAFRLDIVRADGRGRRTLVPDVGLGGDVSWSPDGRTLAATLGDLPQRIWLVDVSTGRRSRLLPPHAGEYEEGGAQWSPDGRWIAFTRTEQQRGSRIFLVRPDGTGLRPLVATR